MHKIVHPFFVPGGILPQNAKIPEYLMKAEIIYPRQEMHE